ERNQLHRTGDGAPPAAHMLRRRRMLDLVEAAPGARYEAIGQFVDVAGVEAAEAALGKAHREAKKGCEKAQADLSGALETLEQLTRLLDDLRAAEAEAGRSEARAEERRATLEKSGQALTSATRVCRTALEQKLGVDWAASERLLGAPHNYSMEPGASLALALR